MKDLRQLTSDVVLLGPFVSASCVTLACTAVSLSSTGAMIMKQGGSSNTAISSCTAGIAWAHVTSAAGMYKLTVSSSWTDMPGDWNVLITSTSFLPVFKECRVVPGAIFDAYYCTTAASYPVNLSCVASYNTGSIFGVTCSADAMADVLKVDVHSIEGNSSAANMLLEFTCDAISANDGLLLISSDNDFLGSDSQVLISADAQNLEDTLDVNVGAIAGDSCNVAEFAAWINAGISGNDNKALLSSDASWLTPDASAVIVSACTTIKANVVEIAGDSCNVADLIRITSDTIGADNLMMVSSDNAFLGSDSLVKISSETSFLTGLSCGVNVGAIYGNSCIANNLTEFSSNVILDNAGVNVGGFLTDTSTAQDLVDDSSLIANLDAAISTRSSDNAAAIWDSCSVLETSDGSAQSLSFEQLQTRTYMLLNNEMDVCDASGESVLFTVGASTGLATGKITDNATSTVREEWDWSADT